MADDRDGWDDVIRGALLARIQSVPVDGAATEVRRALESAGVEFPSRERRPAPQTPEDHLWESARLLELSLTADDTLPGGYHVQDDHCSAQVAAAEVHARIAHAWGALAMLARQEQPAPDAPGLAALERLASAVEVLATGEGLDVLQGIARALDSIIDGRQGALRTSEVRQF
jgi:hypothetical protein